MSNSLFGLKNDTIFVVAEAAGGVYNANQLKTIAEISEEDSAFLKITEDERIGFMIPPDKIPEVQAKLSSVGVFLRHYRSKNFASPKACLGELCPKAEQDALGVALEISPLLSEKLKDSQDRITIGINGCAVACVASATDDIHIVGHESGYKIYIGGKSTEIPKVAELICEVVAKEKIGEAIFSILDKFYSLKQEDEQLCDVIERVGHEPFLSCFSTPTDSLLSSSLDSSEALDLDLPAPPEDSSQELLDVTAEEELALDLPPPPEDSSQELSEVAEEELGLDLPAAQEEELGLDLPAAQEEELGLDLPQELPEAAVEEAEQDEVEVEKYNDYDEDEEYPILTDQDGRTSEKPINIFDEPDEDPVTIREKQRVSIKVVGETIAVKLPNGLDFFVPHGSLIEGESIEMQIEKEYFVIENMYGKLHIKYGSLELTIPLEHLLKEEEEEDPKAA